MKITEFYRVREDGVILDRTYSDDGHYIIQVGTGIKYEEAIDPRNMNRTYIESEEYIPRDENYTQGDEYDCDDSICCPPDEDDLEDIE